ERARLPTAGGDPAPPGARDERSGGGAGGETAGAAARPMPKRAPPVYPVRNGMPASHGTSADFHELGRMIACAYSSPETVRASARRRAQPSSPWRSIESKRRRMPRILA